MGQHKGLRALGLGIVLAVTVGACSSATPGAAQQERSNAAWAEGYAEMARAYQEQIRQQRADAAYSLRWTKLAEYIENGGKIGS